MASAGALGDNPTPGDTEDRRQEAHGSAGKAGDTCGRLTQTPHFAGVCLLFMAATYWAAPAGNEGQESHSSLHDPGKNQSDTKNTSSPQKKTVVTGSQPRLVN